MLANFDEEQYPEIVATYGDDGASIVNYLQKDGSYLGAFSDLEAETSYTLLMLVESIYGKTYLVSATKSTTAIEYTGELVLGKYYMQYQVNESFLAENTFTLVGTEDPNEFILKNFGTPCSVRWHATYDPAASTLTCEGLLVGAESKGNRFGYPLDYFNGDETKAWGIFAYNSLEGDEINDPIVFKIDPSTKQIVELNTYIQVFVADLSSGKVLGNIAIFAPGTKVELQPAASSVKAAVSNFAKQLVKVQNPAMSRVIKGIDIIGSYKCTKLNMERGLRTVKVQAEPCARQTKSNLTTKFVKRF